MRRDPKTNWWRFHTTGKQVTNMTRDRALRLLRGEEKGVAEWNLWWDSPALSKDIPDLSNADLKGWGMDDIRLRFARLNGADLRDSSLCRADLREADLKDARLSGADLSGADLRGADLYGADLTDAWLREADLGGASHVDSNGYGRLNGADLRGVNLRGAKLIDARLRSARLNDADLTGADLSGADLTDAQMDGAKVNDVRLCLTTLVDMDLTSLAEASGIVHFGPSIVDWTTVVKSRYCPRLHEFLIRAGTPEIVATYTLDMVRATTGFLTDLMRSAFISYGGPDSAFAMMLYEALLRNGAQRLFLFTENAIPGDQIHRTVRDGIQSHDRMILICSEASLNRKGVRDEILKLLARETREGVDNLLIPVDLDGYVRDWKPGDDPGLGPTLCDRVLADFRGWAESEDVFSKGVGKLLLALRRNDPIALA